MFDSDIVRGCMNIRQSLRSGELKMMTNKPQLRTKVMGVVRFEILDELAKSQDFLALLSSSFMQVIKKESKTGDIRMTG